MRRTEVLQGIRLIKFEQIYGRTRCRALSQGEAALGVSERTFRRWRDRYDADGAEGLYDRRLGKASAKRAPVDEIERALALYRRFACILADTHARLGADVDRYSFIAVDSHRLLLAGLPAHCKPFDVARRPLR